MSSLWTPSGEHRVPYRPPAGTQEPATTSPTGPTSPSPEVGSSSPEPSGPPGSSAGPREAAQAPSPEASGQGESAANEEIERLRRELAGTPAEQVIANHCYGLFELATIYLSLDPPLLPKAQLAIDALGALVDTLGPRLGQAHGPLSEALAQIRLAFVRLSSVPPPASAAGTAG